MPGGYLISYLHFEGGAMYDVHAIGILDVYVAGVVE